MHVITVTRETTATPDAIWELWADVPGRTRWDGLLEYAKLDGPFQPGAFGAAKLKGQPERTFEILECVPRRRYTDRFFLPAGGKMDWVHTVQEVAGRVAVTFDVSVRGPTAFILLPIMKMILGRDLPATVEKLIAVAEQP